MDICVLYRIVAEIFSILDLSIIHDLGLNYIRNIVNQKLLIEEFINFMLYFMSTLLKGCFLVAP